MSIQLGKTYRDRITGFCGVATGFVTYLSGCNQALLAPQVDSTGGLRNSEWFDVQRLAEQPGDPIVLDNTETPGCDRQAPRR